MRAVQFETRKKEGGLILGVFVQNGFKAGQRMSIIACGMKG
jgi:hypothetical protein